MMEWLGTGFSLTIGGLRLRVRIALEDAPLEPRSAANAATPEAAGPAVAPPAPHAQPRWN